MKTKLKNSNKIISLVLALVMVVSLLPMNILMATAAPAETSELPTSYNGWKPTYAEYTEGLTQYFKYGGYLYKAVWKNCNATSVVLYKSSSDALYYMRNGNNWSINLRKGSTGNSDKLTVYQLPKTVNGVLFAYGSSSTEVKDTSSHILEITCVGVKAPTWTWSNDKTSANAVFVSEDGKAQVTMGATVTSGTVAAGNCKEKDKITYTASATFNGTAYSDVKTVDGAAGNHTGGKATCTAKAVCEVCGTEYGDTNPDNHNIIIDQAVAPDCENTGLTEGQHCEYCDAMTIAQKTIPAFNHKGTLVQAEGKDATCTEVGYAAYEYCTACDYTTYEEIPALNHKDTLIQAEGKDATCTEVGYAAYEYCTACDYTTYEEIPVLEHVFSTNGICDVCGEVCVHESTYQDLIRPVQNADGTWGKGKIVEICNICGNSSLVQEVERDHEGYKVFDETALELEAILNSGKMTDKWKNDYTNRLNGLRNSAYYQVYTEIETAIPSMTESLESIIAEIEAGLADGTMIKADFTYMTSLFDEINALIDNDPNKLIPSESGRFQGIYYGYYMSCKNDGNHSQADYDQNMAGNNWEGQIEDILAGIKDGSALKADYTAIDEAIAELDEKLADENLTDEAKAELEEIKAELEEMKKNPLSSKADLAELEKALEDYETEVDAGIEDGTAVKVNGKAIVNKMLDEWAEKIEAEGLVDAYIEFVHNNKATEEAIAEDDEIQKFAESLEGSVAENADNIKQLEGMVSEFLACFENCLSGAHNVREYEVIEAAKCGENAVEEGACWFCGEIVTREAEDTALTHSFTKYEVTEEAKCGVEGKEVATCDNGCGETDEKAIDALAHTDADGDYICDLGCGYEFEKPFCADCGLAAHDGGVSEYICLIINIFKLLFSFIMAIK